ncbi:DUF262 domain-containing protein [Brevibacterium sp. 50QC2O2]|uniref:DUF262 domain-containing protein n=1 Tax=Brevibacterium sp. 50QC2O2 TaxID=2968459 RepID=UPI00211BBA38|nr:DUF262 domain-containing protein [Brevibacterium sp. 50QC2O2]MCQ9388537.1 DUF262 domain-containing protein [Brevibacterium sp. 50QC2O2]
MRGQVTEVYKIYDSRDKELVIPVYQRNYDWKIDNCRQLLDDLAELIATGRRKHFFGAVVGKPDSSWEWVVIDGQQRLTTVSLLMLALSRLVDDGAIEAPDPGLGERLRRNYLLKDQATGDTRFKLKPVKNDARAYRRLFGPESEFIERSNVTANYRYFLTELPKLGLDADQIWDAICRLEVMHLDLEPEDDPQRIFESLNSTGLALSEADKIRNLVLMGLSAKDQEVVYEDFWNRIEVNVGYETDDFLRWYLTAKTSKTPRFDRVYESFKKFAADTGLRGAALLAEVRDYSDCYRRVRAADTGSKAADAKLRKLNILRQDVALPFFMPVIADFRAGALSEGEFVRVIDIIESYMFRRFACDIPTNGLNKVFATLYAELRRIQTPDSRFSDVLAYSLRRREGSGIFPDDQWFAEDFATHNLYKIRSERRQYMFECLENGDSNDVRDIAGRLAEGTLSVEHIMPQTLTEAWRAELGQDATEIHETWLHRIGNLTVTGYNSSYSNSPYEQKRTTENGFAHSPYRLNQEMKESPVWTVEQLRARSERLVREALAYWDYPQTSFVPPKPQLPVEPLGTDTEFTNRIAIRFEYQDATATVRN